MPRYHTNSKEVLRDGKHFADCIDDGAARLIADALNERKGMPQIQTCDRCKTVYSGQNQCPLCVGITSGLAPVRIEPPTQTQQSLPLDGVDGPLFVGDRVPPRKVNQNLMRHAKEADLKLLTVAELEALKLTHRNMPFVCRYPTVRQENDEYACSCGARWAVEDGEDHP